MALIAASACSPGRTPTSSARVATSRGSRRLGRLAQPAQLRRDVEQAAEDLVLERLVDRREELQVQAMGRRRHVLEVREHPAGREQVEDLAAQRALALVPRWWIAIDATSTSKRPSSGSGSPRLCPTSSTRSSPAKRLPAASA